jgi:hypothetical protein
VVYRIVTVTIQPGRAEEYWQWSREIVQLWNEARVNTLGIFQATSEGGQDLAIWITGHRSEGEAQELFQQMYGSDKGQEVITRRPPLVADTKIIWMQPWEMSPLK